MFKRFEQLFQKTPDEQAERFAALVMNSPAARQLAIEEEQSRLAAALQLAEKREQLRCQRDETLPTLRAAKAEAEAHERECRAKLDEATKQVARCGHEETRARLSFNSEIDNVKFKLRELALPMIDESIHELLKEHERTRMQSPSEEITKSNWITGERKVSSNRESIIARLAAILDALRQAEAMKIEALSEAETAARLDELRKSLPPIVMN